MLGAGGWEGCNRHGVVSLDRPQTAVHACEHQRPLAASQTFLSTHPHTYSPPLHTHPPAGSAERALTGLLIHCAADGLALGAAMLSGDARLNTLVAFAMVLHKVRVAAGVWACTCACARCVAPAQLPARLWGC